MKKVYLSGTLLLITVFLTVLIQHLPEAESPEPREAIEDFFKLQLARKAGPTGKVEPADLYQVEQQIASMGKVLSKTNAKSLSWSELGPDNVGAVPWVFLPIISIPTGFMLVLPVADYGSQKLVEHHGIIFLITVIFMRISA